MDKVLIHTINGIARYSFNDTLRLYMAEITEGEHKGKFAYGSKIKTALENLEVEVEKSEVTTHVLTKRGYAQYYYDYTDYIYVINLMEGEFSSILAHGKSVDIAIANLEECLSGVSSTVRGFPEETLAEQYKEYGDSLDYFETISHEEAWRNLEEPAKFDNGKPRTDLIRPEFILAIGKVLAYGAEKYNEPVGDTPNYLKGDGFNYSRIIGSLERHIQEFKMGIEIDPESGEPHLAAAAANLMFLLTYQLSDKGIDDRTILKKPVDKK